MDLPLRAKRLVLGALVRAGLVWAVPVLAVGTSPWLHGVSTPGAPMLVAVAVVPLLVPLAAAVFPHEAYGGWVASRLVAASASSHRAVNLADQLAIAGGTHGAIPHEVLLLDSSLTNVAAIPTRTGILVVATAGADRLLRRDDYEALATQYVVAGCGRTGSAAAPRVRPPPSSTSAPGVPRSARSALTGQGYREPVSHRKERPWPTR